MAILTSFSQGGKKGMSKWFECFLKKHHKRLGDILAPSILARDILAPTFHLHWHSVTCTFPPQWRWHGDVMALTHYSMGTLQNGDMLPFYNFHASEHRWYWNIPELISPNAIMSPHQNFQHSIMFPHQSFKCRKVQGAKRHMRQKI